MTRILRLALAAGLTASFSVAAPPAAAAKMSCCGKSCPSTPKKKGKCCQIAPAQKKDVAGLVRRTVVSRPDAVSIVAQARHAVVVVVFTAAPPACVIDEAPSGLSPPARA